MRLSKKLEAIRNLFDGILGEHLISISNPYIYYKCKSENKESSPLIHISIDLMVKIVEQLEDNGINWQDKVSIGNITKAFYQIEVQRLSKKGF